MLLELLNLLLPITILHFAGGYMRYLPFSPFITEEEKGKIFSAFFRLALFNMAWQGLLFCAMGITVLAYKIVLTFGWVPYFLAMFYLLPQYKPQQIFVLGMQAVYMFLLHCLSGLTMILLHPDMADRTPFLAEQMWLYDLYFFLTLPLARPLFLKMMPSTRFINDKTYSYYIAVLPLLLVFNVVPTSLIGDLWTPSKLISWLILLLGFFVFYKYISLEAKDAEDQIRIRSANELMRKSIEFLRHYALVSQDSAKEMSLIRHDFRHHIRTLYQLLHEGNIEKSLSLLETFDDNLERTVVHPYCLNPILNAVLTIYFHKAEDMGIPLTYKINIPPSLPGVESPMAFMIANLLENAIEASAAMAPDKRYLHFHLNVKGSQVVLSIENYYDKPLRFNEEGYPMTTKTGHGLGMISVASFMKEYKGYHTFTQEKGRVRFEGYFMVDDAMVTRDW